MTGLVAYTSPSGVIGVAIVTYNSAAVIGECLRSVLRSTGVAVRIVVVDNASSDETCAVVQTVATQFAATHTFAQTDASLDAAATADLTLVRSPDNGGYAHGVNTALRMLLPVADINLFWILNPDCEVAADTARTYFEAGSDGAFSLMGSRTVYLDRPDTIQTDGGKFSRWNGVCHAVNLGAPAATTPLPAADQIDFITGANCVASRRFVERAGLMREDYFLYYEEVDWAFRRGDLPLRIVPGVQVRHHGGTSIGSGSIVRRPTAFSNYLNFRSRSMFLVRFAWPTFPGALAYAVAKVVQLSLLGHPGEAWAILCAILRRRPSPRVRARLPHDLD